MDRVALQNQLRGENLCKLSVIKAGKDKKVMFGDQLIALDKKEMGYFPNNVKKYKEIDGLAKYYKISKFDHTTFSQIHFGMHVYTRLKKLSEDHEYFGYKDKLLFGLNWSEYANRMPPNIDYIDDILKKNNVKLNSLQIKDFQPSFWQTKSNIQKENINRGEHNNYGSIANEDDFKRYMINNGPNSEGARSNYISWLRYVNGIYCPDFEILTKEVVDKIFQDLRKTQNTRNKYTSNSAVSDIKSSLNKYLEYVNSNKDQDTGIITDISSVLGEIDTTSKTEIETRLGQGKYRKNLIKIWRKCAVTEFDKTELLIASHIKPWKVSTDVERVDPFNGFLLCPNLDRLFDVGYISFGNNGNIIISSVLNALDIEKLGIYKSMRLYKIAEKNKYYLNYHRNNILRQ